MVASRAAMIGSCTCRAMSSSDRRLLSSFRPCRGHRLRFVEDDGAHNVGGARADRWTLPQVHVVIVSFLVRNGVFRLRMVRSVGVVLIPTLTLSWSVRRKLAMALFCGGKKGVDHGEVVMIRGCRFELCADGIRCSEQLLPY